MTASHLELHLLFTVAESLAAATADHDHGALRRYCPRSPVHADVLVLLDAVDAEADVLDAIITRHAWP